MAVNLKPAGSGSSQALGDVELQQIDAYWRACNYLAAGMIYLRDNPLLREPLKAEHVKRRLLGHWGASPGLSFAYVHLNRLINKYDLDAIFLAGPGHGAPGVLAPVYLEGTYSEVYPNKSEDVDGMLRVLQGVLVPRRHRQPLHAGDARLDPRGRRARLQRLARVRRGVRQPGPARRRRRRRRRSGDRAAGHVVALQQVPQPDPRRRGAADPAPQRLQDQQPDAARRASPTRSWRACSRATAGRRTSSRATTRGRCTRRWRRRWRSACWRSAAIQQEARASGKATRAALADDRPAHAQGLDRPEGGGRAQGRGLLALAPGAAVRHARQPGAPEAARRLAAQLQARGAVRRRRPAHPRAQGARAQGHAAHGRQPARQRRPAPQAAAHARLPRLRRQGRQARARPRPRTRARSASSCATS